MRNINLQNRNYVYGIITVDIGVALLLVGCFISNPIILGIAAGFLVFGLGCFAVGYYKEHTQSLADYTGI